jgi:hypothetical protein
MGFRISITIYILIILILAILKPNFIYDYDKKEYRKINNISLLQILSIVLAIVCAVLFHEKNNIDQNIQYIPFRF